MVALIKGVAALPCKPGAEDMHSWEALEVVSNHAVCLALSVYSAEQLMRDLLEQPTGPKVCAQGRGRCCRGAVQPAGAVRLQVQLEPTSKQRAPKQPASKQRASKQERQSSGQMAANWPTSMNNTCTPGPSADASPAHQEVVELHEPGLDCGSIALHHRDQAVLVNGDAQYLRSPALGRHHLLHRHLDKGMAWRHRSGFKVQL